MAHLQTVTAATLGKIVERPTAALPQTTDEALFTISGGPIILQAIWGRVTTVIQTQANNTKLKYNPDDTGADQDLCAVLNITADPVGEVYSITGTVGDAMVSDLLIGNVVLASPILLYPGAIELDCAASNTGSVEWGLIYTEAAVGASVAAA